MIRVSRKFEVEGKKTLSKRSTPQINKKVESAFSAFFMQQSP